MAIDDILDQDMEQKIKIMNPEQRDLLYDFTKVEYNNTFTYLLYKSIIEKYPDKKEDIEFCISRLGHMSEEITMDKVIILLNTINLFYTPCDLITYRGTDLDTLIFTSIISKEGERRKDKNIEEGDIITNLIPWSTTTSKLVAESFTCGKYPPLLLQIVIPKNTQSLWLKPFSLYKKENELLLPSNLSFIVEKEDTTSERKIKSFILKPIGCDNNE